MLMVGAPIDTLAAEEPPMLCSAKKAPAPAAATATEMMIHFFLLLPSL